MNNKRFLIIIIIISAALLILLLNMRIIIAYGTVNNNYFRASVIDCESDERDYLVINNYLLNNLNETGVMGLTLWGLMTVLDVNSSYEPKTACFARHEEDVLLDVINYTINASEASMIRYNITNFQNNRLFYECTLNTDCIVIRDFFTGYLDPDEEHVVYFNVTCEPGVHNATVRTVFVDELVAYHTVIDNLLITSV